MQYANASTEEFSQEVKNALYQSPILDKYLNVCVCPSYITNKGIPEFDTFWQPYLTNKIIQRNWDHIDMYQRIWRTAERLRQITHPKELSQKRLHEISRQYIYVFCHQAWRLIKRVRREPYKTCQFRDLFCLLEMALLNDCQEGIRFVLRDTTLDDMISHALDTSSDQWFHHLSSLSAECGNIILLEKIFLNPNFQQDPHGIRGRAFLGAVREGRLDVVRFIIEPRMHLPKFKLKSYVFKEELLAGMLKSRSVDFSSQLFELLPSRYKEKDCPVKGNFQYDELLSYVAKASPQRVDVAEWLLNQGASVQLEAHEKEKLMKGRRPFSDPLRQAIRGGNEKMVYLLLNRGPHLETGGGALLDAVMRGRLDIVRILVERGACVTQPPSTSNVSVHMKWTQGILMERAVQTENEELCRYLVEYGAIVNGRPLKAAVGGSLVSMVQLLLELGSEVTKDIISTDRLSRSLGLSCSELMPLLQAAYTPPSCDKHPSPSHKRSLNSKHARRQTLGNQIVREANLCIVFLQAFNRDDPTFDQVTERLRFLKDEYQKAQRATGCNDDN